ncbi:hypothetical protein NQ315_001056 [Exocentrus adspersus]|uniref:Cuticle protein 64 n=1 Tax=Exocentrus adspersus TaxID=1586481 RepID=A0AAV8WEC8_9CUCU|nr:hypothetical protein NQ315_001056 [Exocentrus adspersus]
MFKLAVLSVLVYVASGAPAPGFLHGGYALPAATSYSSRVDVVHHSTPIIKTYHAPVIATPIIAKSYVAPLVSGYGLGHGYGLGLGHGYGGYGYGLEHGYGLH